MCLYQRESAASPVLEPLTALSPQSTITCNYSIKPAECRETCSSCCSGRLNVAPLRLFASLWSRLPKAPSSIFSAVSFHSSQSRAINRKLLQSWAHVILHDWQTDCTTERPPHTHPSPPQSEHPCSTVQLLTPDSVCCLFLDSLQPRFDLPSR